MASSNRCRDDCNAMQEAIGLTEEKMEIIEICNENFVPLMTSTSNNRLTDGFIVTQQPIEIKQEKIETVEQNTDKEVAVIVSNVIYPDSFSATQNPIYIKEEKIKIMYTCNEKEDPNIASNNKCADEYSTMQQPIIINGEKSEIADAKGEDCSRPFKYESENIYKDTEDEICDQGSFDLMPKTISGVHDLNSSGAAEMSPLQYREVGSISYIKQENTKSEIDLVPFAVYSYNFPESEVAGYPSSVEDVLENVAIILDRNYHKFASATADPGSKRYSENMSLENLEVHEIREYPNEIETDRVQPANEGEVKAQWNERNTLNTSYEINSETGHRNAFKKYVATRTREKTYSCKICNYESKASSNFKRHIRFHTGEKPFTCEVCGYKCTDGCGLKKHFRSHSREKPYRCELCEYRCTESYTLKRHMLTHTVEKPYKCNMCEYECSQNFYLQRHMRNHTGNKPYRCEICNNRFTESHRLKMHIRTHTGEKPFTCETCECKFSRNSNLKKHMRTHKSDEPKRIA